MKLSSYTQLFCIAGMLLITACRSSTESLKLFKETSHYKLYCTPSDTDSATSVITCIEDFYTSLSAKFSHTYSHQIDIFTYPDLESFHRAINKPDAPDWIIGQSDTHTIKGVSPAHPGPYHSYDSVLCAYKVNLAQLFIEDMCAHHLSIPRWLHQGVALYVAQFFDSNKVAAHLTQNKIQLPSIDQLDAIPKYDTITFDQYDGFRVSYSIVEYIDTQWGWETIRQLLKRYKDFETILGLSKDTLTQQWKATLQETTK